MAPTPNLIEVPYSLTIATRADGVVRARPRGGRFRASIALLVLCSATALYPWRGEGWPSGGTGTHTKPATVEALLVMGVLISFLWRCCCAPRITFSRTSVCVVDAFARIRVPLSDVERFDQAGRDGMVSMRVRGRPGPLCVFGPRKADSSAEWLNAMLPECAPRTAEEAPEVGRRGYFAVSDLAVPASFAIAVLVLLAW